MATTILADFQKLKENLSKLTKIDLREDFGPETDFTKWLAGRGF
ncbi:MAG TPA: hypothetical protein PLB98_08040 [bacterium]|nr:hypothetical protein [bacterium]